MDKNKPIDQYGVIGNPVKHSRSPQIHRLFARQTGQILDYRAIHSEHFEVTVDQFRNQGGLGLNVTIPFKEQAFSYAQTHSDRARKAGTVNTLCFADNTLHGDNTDGIGLVRDLTHHHHVTLENRRILLLGAGGAARGVIQPLLDQHPQRLVIANRTVDKAKKLADRFQGPLLGCGLGELEDEYDLIINATAASLQGKKLDLPETLIHSRTAAYDMMYGPDTPFMIWAREHGANKIMDGLGMLVEQAAESFRLWRGVMPDTGEILALFQNVEQI